jgi:hypothetical protein
MAHTMRVLTNTERALRLADRVLAEHYRGPQQSQGFVSLEDELRAAIVEAVVELLDERDRGVPVTAWK